MSKWINRKTLIDAIMAMPAEVKPETAYGGKWEYGENRDGMDGYFCSKCGEHVKWNYEHETIYFIPRRYRYCPYCGTRMDG